MEEYNCKIKKIEFNKTDFYKENNQWIIGLTVNKEIESYRNGKNYNKYEFNLWLGLIGLHMIVRNKISN
jgi:hypothetical protein